ncbi:MAG TPA: nucleotidyltransferase family protein [Bryobacteraceae bacterium]|nr:nucleotidyltransferase family protein [Bryobacteraceae bacterium]
MTAGIILAAGASRRMGRPKALLEYRGETFVGRLVRVLQKFCDPVIVVLGHHAAAIRDHVRAGVVVNPDPDRGQLSSLQTALERIDSDFLFIPVDSPTVREETIEKLISAVGCGVVIPRYHGRRGHPVCVSRSLRADFLALQPTAETRAAIDARPALITYLDVDDPGVLADIDDAEAYRRIAT